MFFQLQQRQCHIIKWLNTSNGGLKIRIHTATAMVGGIRSCVALYKITVPRNLHDLKFIQSFVEVHTHHSLKFISQVLRYKYVFI